MKIGKKIVLVLLVVSMIVGSAMSVPLSANAASNNVPNFILTPTTTTGTEYSNTLSWQDLNSPNSSSNNINYTIITDTSGSMSTGDRIGHTKSAIIDFIRLLKDGEQITLVTFDNTATTLHPQSNDILSLEAKANSMTASGSTNVSAGLQEAINAVNADDETDASTTENVFILICDGEVNDTSSQITQAKELGIPIYTINVVDSSGSDLEAISNETGGKTYKSDTAEEMSDILTGLKDDISLYSYEIYINNLLVDTLTATSYKVPDFSDTSKPIVSEFKKNDSGSYSLSGYDEGTAYSYQVIARHSTDKNKDQSSNVIEIDALSDIKGYYYLLSPSGELSDSIPLEAFDFVSVEDSNDFNLLALDPHEDTYLHVYAVDNAGNFSDEFVDLIPAELLIPPTLGGTGEDNSSTNGTTPTTPSETEPTETYIMINSSATADTFSDIALVPVETEPTLAAVDSSLQNNFAESIPSALQVNDSSQTANLAITIATALVGITALGFSLAQGFASSALNYLKFLPTLLVVVVYFSMQNQNLPGSDNSTVLDAWTLLLLIMLLVQLLLLMIFKKKRKSQNETNNENII